MGFRRIKCLDIFLAIILIVVVMAGGCGHINIKANGKAEDLDGYKRLYYDFYGEGLQEIEKHMEGISLIDLDLNGIYELIVFLPGASASGSCEIYTIEDDEVRAFSGYSPYGLNQAGEREYEVPNAKNAIGSMLWANLPQDKIEGWQVEHGGVFIPYCNRKTGEKIFALVSGNSAGEKDSWHTWYKFENLHGDLSASEIFSYEKVGGEDSKSGKFVTLDWKINNISVSEDEYKESIVNFKTDFNLEYEVMDFDYSKCSIKMEDGDNFLEFLQGFKPGILECSSQ